MSNLFDKILKENIEAVFPSLSKKLLGIEIVSSEELKDKLQRTTEREADFLRKVVTTNNEEFIIQLEFQTTDDLKMLERMRVYHALITQRYRLPIKQYVIYLARKAPKMRTQLDWSEIYTGYELIDMQKIAYQDLLNSDILEEVVLAVLGDFQGEGQMAVLHQILGRLSKLSDSPSTLNKYIYHLVTFARLRNLTEFTEKQLEDMGIVYDIEQDAFFKKGIQKGELKGIHKKAREVVTNLLQTQKLTLEEIAEVSGLSLEEVQKIQQEMK